MKQEMSARTNRVFLNPAPGNSSRCRLSSDRIVVAIDAVGNERVARNDRVLVELHRAQSDHRSLGPVFHLNGVVLGAFSQAATASANTEPSTEGFHAPELGCHFSS